MSFTKNKDHLDANEELRLLMAKHMSSLRKVPEGEKALIDIARSLRSITGTLAALVAGERGILRKGDQR